MAGFPTKMESSTASLSPAIGVLVADSSQMQCQLLVGALRRRPEFHVTSCILDAEAILRSIALSSIDVAILSADGPSDSWPNLAIVRRLHVAHPDVAKIILLDRYDRDLVVNAFRSGAKGLFCFSQYPFDCCVSASTAFTGDRSGPTPSSCSM